MNLKRLITMLVAIVAIVLLDVVVLSKDSPPNIDGPNIHTNLPPTATSTGTSIKNQGNQTITQISTKTGVRGTVTLGPTCPVERIPPDPKCAPKPFGTSIGIYSHNVLVSFVKTNNNGTYAIDLPPGVYTFDPAGGNPFPSCASQTVIVPNAGYATLNLSCDTGIR